jgi:methyl-accepting chemotaxis protein
MFSSIRARILAASVLIVDFALAVSTLVNCIITRSYNDDAIDHNLAAISSAVGIGDWVAIRNRLVSSLQDAALAPDPLPAFRQVAAAGGFGEVYVGYANKTFRTTGDVSTIHAGYDPTARPWYESAAQAGKPVVTLCHTSTQALGFS